MNKQEFLDALVVKYHKVGQPTLQEARSIPWMNIYTVLVYDLTSGGILPLNVGFAVVDENLPSEAAYWSPEEPGQVPAGRQFADDVQAFITARIEDGTIEAGWVSRINPVDDTAVAWALRDVSGVLTEVKALLWRAAGGEIDFRLVDVVVNTGD